MTRTRTLLIAASLGALHQATYSQQQQATTDELLDAANQNLDDMSGLVDQLIGVIVTGDAERAVLKQQVLDLIAGGTATAAKAQALFDKSEAVENKMRASIPGVPPVGGTPLLQSYSARADFDSAVAGYTGPEAVNVDGGEVKAGTSPALEYYTHSGDGSVSTTGPTD